MSTVEPVTTHDTGSPPRLRRFRLIPGSGPGKDRVLPEPAPKQVSLSPRSACWLEPLTEALGPSYRVMMESVTPPASLPMLAAHVKALTRSWDAFPPLRHDQTA